MGTNSGIRPVGFRHGLWLGAACLLVLAVGVWIALRFSEPSPVSAEFLEPIEGVGAPSTTEFPPVVRGEPPSHLPKKAGRPAPRPPAQKESPPPLSIVADAPERAEPSLEDAPSDPFEPREGQKPEIRTLVAVGDIQLGVVRNSRVRDEEGLKRVLVRIGGELEKRIREPQQQDTPGLQQLLDDYREELGKYMDGEVELRGPDWMIGVEVGPPRPREEWWVPRPR